MADRRIDLVVTVKAYPNVSQKHGEVVCVAGVRTDTEAPRWVRLFPVAFRDLPDDQQFKKYQRMSLRVGESHDPRPESVMPRCDTIQLGPRLPAGTWEARRRLIEPLLVESMCEVQRRQEVDRTSLAVFRPAEVLDLTIEPDDSDWNPKQKAILDQMGLFTPNEEKTKLVKIPWKVSYRYRCSSKNCPTHNQTVIDWELGQAFRNFKAKASSESQLVELIRKKWLGEMWSSSRESALFVGNMHLHPTSFLVLGVFWPPARTAAGEQLRLGL